MLIEIPTILIGLLLFIIGLLINKFFGKCFESQRTSKEFGRQKDCSLQEKNSMFLVRVLQFFV